MTFIVCDVQFHVEGDAVGAYIYGKKRLVLVSDRDDPQNMHLTLVCDFNHGDDKRADCHSMSEGSLHVCAESHLTLKHLDTHHTGTADGHQDEREDHRGEIVEHHYDVEGHDHAEHFDKQHRHIDHPDDDN